MYSRIAIASLVALTWSSMPVSAYDGAPVSGGGSVAGTVKFKGTAPAPKQLEATKDTQVCGQHKIMDESLVVSSGGGLANAVVTITGITKGKPMEKVSPVFDQVGCQYVPHVIAFPAGSEVQIQNSDGILHNIHTYSTANPSINRAQPKFKKVLKETFAKPEVIKVTCDAHNWMHGWFVVTDNPYYAVTDAKGAFKLTDVPAGTYDVKVWHETLGESTQKVTVAGGAEAKADFELAAK
jgi:plastocyanin